MKASRGTAVPSAPHTPLSHAPCTPKPPSTPPLCMLRMLCVLRGTYASQSCLTQRSTKNDLSLEQVIQRDLLDFL